VRLRKSFLLWASAFAMLSGSISAQSGDLGRIDFPTSGSAEAQKHFLRGALLLQAELAACHATALSFAATDWARIVALYDELLAVQDTPVVALNRAVAIAMADGPAAGLPLLDQLAGDPALSSSHRVWAVRADLHRRAGQTAAALADYDRALELVSNQAERRYLADARRLAEERAAPY